MLSHFLNSDYNPAINVSRLHTHLTSCVIIKRTKKVSARFNFL